MITNAREWYVTVIKDQETQIVHSWKPIKHITDYHRIEIVHYHIEFVMWKSSIVTLLFCIVA